MMKKLMLNVESLVGDGFKVVGRLGRTWGTVEGASELTVPTDHCLPTMLLSGCISNCMASGPRPCLNTQGCC